ncbi:MAG: Trm112 family protein [Actinomycetales bacterium]
MSTVEPWLRAILRCPACRHELRDQAPERLVCVNPACGLGYRVDDGIPVLLVDEAIAPGDSASPE